MDDGDEMTLKNPYLPRSPIWTTGAFSWLPVLDFTWTLRALPFALYIAPCLLLIWQELYYWYLGPVASEIMMINRRWLYT